MNHIYSYNALTLASTITKNGNKITGEMSACRIGDLLPQDGQSLAAPQVFLPVIDPAKPKPVVTWEKFSQMNPRVESSPSSYIMAKTRNRVQFSVPTGTSLSVFARARRSVLEQAIALDDARSLLDSTVNYYVLSPMILEPHARVHMGIKSLAFPAFNPLT
jgi:hypothetical protein